MRKRKTGNENYIQEIRLNLFPRWASGEDVSDEVNRILELKPNWKENPPGAVGRNAYIFWDEFKAGPREVS